MSKHKPPPEPTNPAASPTATIILTLDRAILEVIDAEATRRSAVAFATGGPRVWRSHLIREALYAAFTLPEVS